MKKTSIKKICLSAVMAALYVGLDFLAVTVSAPLGGNMKLSLNGLPVIIISAFFGPWWGAATGFVGAFIGQLLTYGLSATTFLWVLPAVFRGIVFGFLFKAFKCSLKPHILCIETVISGFVVTAVNTAVMYVDSIVYCYPIVLLGVSLINRILAATITSVVFALILQPILKVLKKAVKI